MVVLYASISVLNWMRAETGSQCKDSAKRGVTWALLGSLKTSRAAFDTAVSKPVDTALEAIARLPPAGMTIIQSWSAADTALCISTIEGYVVTLTLVFILHK